MFILATNYPLKTGLIYKINLILSPSTSFHLDKTVSVLTLNGNAISYSAVNSVSSVDLTFTFSMSSASNIIDFKFSEVFIF